MNRQDTGIKSNGAFSGILWSGIERFSVQGIQFVLSMIIARLLLPSDYGLIAMIGIFLAIAQSFIDSGFSSALIQKQDRTEIDYSTVFYFNIVVGIAMYLLIYSCAPSIAFFYEEPELEGITRIVGLNLIISSLAVVQRAKLTIALNFKLQAYISLISVVLSGSVGVWMAYNGYGVWTLVIQTLLNNILNVLLLWGFAKWLPMLAFSQQSFKILFNFGSKLLLSGLLHTIYTNMYTLVIGKKFAATELGFYNRAFAFSNVVSGNLTELFVRVVYPTQCNLQNDEEKLCHSFTFYIRMVCYLLFPLMIGMCVLAKPLVTLILTDKWLFTADLLQILCLAYMWDTLMRLNHTILSVKGRTDYALKSEIVKKLIAILILLVTLPLGLKAICWGLVVYAFADLFIITRYVRKLIPITLRMEIKEIYPIFLLAISMGGVIYLSTFFIETDCLQLVIGTLVGVLYYLACSHLFHFRELSLLFHLKNRIQ